MSKSSKRDNGKSAAAGSATIHDQKLDRGELWDREPNVKMR